MRKTLVLLSLIFWITVLSGCFFSKEGESTNDFGPALSGFLYLSWNVNYNEELWEKFFNYYKELSDEFSPLIPDLYSNEANIISKRYYPSWQIKEMVIKWSKWKKLVKVSLPLAEKRNDTSSFKDLKFIVSDDFIKIEWTRHSNLKDYDSNYYMIIAYEENILQIIEEFVETKPI